MGCIALTRSSIREDARDLVDDIREVMAYGWQNFEVLIVCRGLA